MQTQSPGLLIIGAGHAGSELAIAARQAGWPHAITLVAEMMKTLAHDRQVFIATQSPYMVDCFALEDVIVASNHEGATQLRTLPRERYQQWLDEEYLVSDLWLKEPVGGDA